MWFRRKHRERASPSGDIPLVVWGGEVHPERLGPHYAVMGQNGSGKTLTIRMLMRTALAPKGELLHRALVYDPKLDFYPVLRGIGIPEARIHILNPFDQRSAAWDLTADIQSRATARQLAANLIARNEKDHPYFTDTPRTILTEIIDTLREKTPRWTLNDVVRLVTSFRFIDVLRAAGPRAQSAIRAHITENAPSTASNILSTLQTKLEDYETVASLWTRTTRPPVSLAAWMDDRQPPSVLLLGAFPEASETLLNVNRAIFQRCSELLLMKEEYPKDHTWFVLDELRVAGEFSALPRTLLAARSKHGHFVLGFQDVHGLRDVYGPDKTEELIGQCHNIGILRLSSPETMDWASRYFGTHEWWAPSYGESSSAAVSVSATPQSSQSHNISLQERRNILASTFRELRPPGRDFGLEGVFATPHDAPWHAHLSPEFLSHYLATESSEPGIIRRPPADQEAAPYTAGLGAALGVDLEEPPDELQSRAFQPSLP